MMKLTKDSKLIKVILTGLFSLFLALALLLPKNPGLYPYPSRDSGVFLYTGWRILNGEMPYTSVWDHKPPFVYLINSIGMWMAGGSVWGVWFLRLLGLTFSIYIIFVILEKHFSKWVAVVASIVWVANLPPFLGFGNFTTEYTIPLQCLSLFLTIKALEKFNKPYLSFFVIGLLGGIAFMTKQTSIGLWLSIGLSLVVIMLITKEYKKYSSSLAGLMSGAVAVILVVLAWFYYKGIVSDFWDQAFMFNFSYIGRGDSNAVLKLFKFFNPAQLGEISLYYCSLLAILIATLRFIYKPKKLISNPLNSILLITIIDFCLEYLLSHMSSNIYEHYLLTFFPSMAILFGFLLSYLNQHIFVFLSKSNKQKYFVLILVILFSSYPIINVWEKAIFDRSYNFSLNEGVIKYVSANSEPDDTLLTWGAETMINFYTKRVAPTRYVYQYPLVTPGYTTEAMVLEFLDDLLTRPPTMLIDSNRPDMPFFQFEIENQAIVSQKESLLSLYMQKEDINGWKIYQLIETKP